MGPSLSPCGPSPGRRARKKEATLQSLRGAAMALVASRGYARVTVEDIAEAADVSVRTFFNYFRSKDEAVLGCHRSRADRMTAALLSRPAGEAPLAGLRAVVLGELGELVGALQTPDGETLRQRLAWIRGDPELRAAYGIGFAEIEEALTNAFATRLSLDPAVDPEPSFVVAVVLSAARIALVHGASGADAAMVVPLADRFLSVLEDELEQSLPPHQRSTFR